MGRRSKIEDHPQGEEIVKRLTAGDDYSKIVEDFRDIRYQDLDYYVKNKLPAILAKSKTLQALADEIEKADVHRGDTYLQLIIGLQKSALDALDDQDPQTDPKSWAMVSREARGYLELLGKALDRIRDQPIQQVNIYTSTQWREVGIAMAEILAPYPDLRVKAAAVLLELEERGAG